MITLILMFAMMQDAEQLKAALRVEDPATAVQPHTDRLQAIKDLATALATQEAEPQYYVVVFSAPYCVPCRVFAASPEMAAIKARYTVTEIDVTQDNRWRVDRVPQVWLCRVVTTRKEPGRRVHRFIGRCTVEELRAREP